MLSDGDTLVVNPEHTCMAFKSQTIERVRKLASVTIEGVPLPDYEACQNLSENRFYDVDNDDEPQASDPDDRDPNVN